MKLTAKEELFAQKCVELDNQTEALRIAYPHMSKWTSKAQWTRASVLANSNKVRQRIKEIKDEMADKEIITKEAILKDLVEISQGSIMDYIDVEEKDAENGSIQVMKIKDLDKLSESQKRRIKHIKTTRYGLEIELYPITDTHQMIAKMCGFNEPDKVDLNNKMTGNDSIDIETMLKLAKKNND